MRPRSIPFAVAATLACALSACGGAAVDRRAHAAVSANLVGEAVQTAPTAWWFYPRVSGDVVSQKLTQNGARLTSIQVAQTHPLLFSVTMVRNSGSYGKQWWWFPGLSAKDLAYTAQILNARPISIDPYVDGSGNTMLAAVLISNSGADAKRWWLFTDADGATLGNDLANNTRRLVDWRQYTKGGVTLNAAVAVANSGPDGTPFWFYPGQTPAQVGALVNGTGKTLVGIQPADPRGATFNVILYAGATLDIPPVKWWYGVTDANLGSLVDGNFWRFSDLKSYVVDGTTYHVVIAVDNTGYSAASAAQAACDANVLSGWRATPPAVGVGTRSASAIYDAAVTQFMKAHNLPGAAIGVVKDGKLVLARGYGLADQASAQLAHPDSLFRIASLSKGITAAAVMAAVDQGYFRLDDAAFPMLGLTPNPSTCCAAGQPNCTPTTCTQPPLLDTITVRNLLNHTGGFSRENGCAISVTPGQPQPLHGTTCASQGDVLAAGDELLVESVAGNSVPLTCQQLIRYWMVDRDNIGSPGIGNAPALVWTPAGASGNGGVMDYSNFGYCVLQAVVEKTTGMSYANWVATQVLSPAGAGALTPGRTNIALGGNGFAPMALDHEVSYYDPANALGQSNYDTRNLCQSAGLCAPVTYGNAALETNLAAGGWVSSPIDLLRVETTLDGSNGKPALLSAANLTDWQRNPNAWGAQLDASRTTLSVSPPRSDYWYGFGFNVTNRAAWWNFGGFTGTFTHQYRGGSLGETFCFDGSGSSCAKFTSGCTCSPVSTAGYGWVVFFNSNTADDQSGALGRMMQRAWWQVVTSGADWVNGDLFDQYGTYTPWMNAADWQSYFNTQAAGGRYPSHLEGQDQVGTPMFRATFAPFGTTHGSDWKSYNGMTCTDFQQKQQTLAAQGYQPASLQSYVGNDGLRRYQAIWIQPAP